MIAIIYALAIEIVLSFTGRISIENTPPESLIPGLSFVTFLSIIAIQTMDIPSSTSNTVRDVSTNTSHIISFVGYFRFVVLIDIFTMTSCGSSILSKSSITSGLALVVNEPGSSDITFHVVNTGEVHPIVLKVLVM